MTRTSVEDAQLETDAVDEAAEIVAQAPIDDWTLLRDVIWPQPAPFPAHD